MSSPEEEAAEHRLSPEEAAVYRASLEALAERAERNAAAELERAAALRRKVAALTPPEHGPLGPCCCRYVDAGVVNGEQMWEHPPEYPGPLSVIEEAFRCSSYAGAAYSEAELEEFARERARRRRQGDHWTTTVEDAARVAGRGPDPTTGLY